jgi:hypothetical protein
LFLTDDPDMHKQLELCSLLRPAPTSCGCLLNRNNVLH